MEKLAAGFIIDENSEIIEIKNGEATAYDGYLYQIDTDNIDEKKVYRCGQDGLINGEFDYHESIADLLEITGQN